jgi:hypothetical protein
LGALVGPVWSPPTRALIHASSVALERPTVVRVGGSIRVKPACTDDVLCVDLKGGYHRQVIWFDRLALRP